MREKINHLFFPPLAAEYEMNFFLLWHYYEFITDTQEIFAEPVSIDDVPDYLDHIKKPMDFKTMGKKLEDYEYKGIDDFEDDFNIMVGNCLSYNERDTIFFRAGVKMRDQGGLIIRQAKREVENIGFDPETGLHTTERLTPKEEFSDDKLMKEIDNFVNDDAREDMPLEVHLKRLLELQVSVLTLNSIIITIIVTNFIDFSNF